MLLQLVFNIVCAAASGEWWHWSEPWTYHKYCVPTAQHQVLEHLFCGQQSRMHSRHHHWRQFLTQHFCLVRNQTLTRRSVSGLHCTSRLLCATRTPRTDCSTSAGGGLAVIYNSVLSVRPQRLPSMMSFKTFEYQLVSVTWARPAFTIANVYRSLNTPVSSFYNDLLDFLCTVGSMSDRLIVCGDLNCLCPDSSVDPGLTVVIDAFGLTHAHLQQ